MRRRNFFLVLIFFAPLYLLLANCQNRQEAKTDPRGSIFAGSEACMKCHQNISQSYFHTVHYLSSRLSSASTVNGSFTSDSNLVSFASGEKLRMLKTDSGMVQAEYRAGKLIEAHKFDLTFGIEKAETHLYWKGNQLFELPVSYFNSLHSWTISPGYSADRVNFTRPVLRRCFECHSSYIREIPQDHIDLSHRVLEYDKSSMILGIGCERCHGAGANHVNFHTQFPNQKKPKYMVNIHALSREQKLDLCGVCHSGNKGQLYRTAFAFKPGDRLSDYKEHEIFHADPNPDKLDVHGNQNGLLATSKCFLKSTMDCSTCHNSHQTERGDLLTFSQRCMNCHKTSDHTFCTMKGLSEQALKANCIDCHMPAKPSELISVANASAKMSIPYLVRTHHIGIYPSTLQRSIKKD